MQFSDITIEGLGRLEAKLLADLEVVRRMRGLLEEHRAIWEGRGPMGSAGGGAAAVAVGSPVAESAAVVGQVMVAPVPAVVRKSLDELVLDFMRGLASGTFTTDDLRRGLRKSGVSPQDGTLKTLINRLLRNGQVEVEELRRGRGGSVYRSLLPRQVPEAESSDAREVSGESAPETPSA